VTAMMLRPLDADAQKRQERVSHGVIQIADVP
jgi:hypothetical protein